VTTTTTTTAASRSTNSCPCKMASLRLGVTAIVHREKAENKPARRTIWNSADGRRVG